MRFVTNATTRLRAALTDPVHGERNVIIVLAAYALVWAVYGAIAKGSQGLHYDMTEVVAWSRDLSYGYLKHPPLAAWIVRLWFSAMPLTEWSYYLLAMLMPAIALWFAWRVSADFLDADKRVIGLALLTLIPFFNFHALKFNVNTVLMPVWAATTVWFLRAYVTRGVRYAALAGFGAALCMLGKYWSIFLLLGLALAALIDSRRAAYFKSPAPWITVAVGLTVLGPHLVWLKQHDFAPFTYAMAVHGALPFAEVANGVAGYFVGSIGYVAAPLAVVALLAWRARAPLADIVWPTDRERRLVAAAFWAPFLLPAVGAMIGGIGITSLWSMPNWTLIVLLLLSSPALTVTEVETHRVLIAALAVPLVFLVASPLVAINVQIKGPAPAANHAAQLAAEIERLWHERTPLPLRFIDGNEEIAYDVAAAAVERPRALPNMPMPSADELRQSGVAIVCFADDAPCRAKASARADAAPGSAAIEMTIVRNYLRFPGKPTRYGVVLILPRQ